MSNDTSSIPERIDGRFKDTRARIIAAARAEIVAFGTAGTRINRIAEAAGTSKERLYSYFRSKEELVAAVAAERMLRIKDAVPFDAGDLVGYVGALADFYAAHPDDVRLSHWFALEQDDEVRDAPATAELAARVEAIRAAQAASTIDASWEPLALLNLLMGVAMAWASAPLLVHRVGGATPSIKTSHRGAAEEAARRLLGR